MVYSIRFFISIRVNFNLTISLVLAYFSFLFFIPNLEKITNNQEMFIIKIDYKILMLVRSI